MNDVLSNNYRKWLHEVLDLSIDFKLDSRVNKKIISNGDIKKILARKLPFEGIDLDDILDSFKTEVMQFCTNFSSKNFMGFPDSGNSVAALGASIIKDFFQQNIINQSFCSPSGTFIEINVINWLRDLIGYETKDNISSIMDVGGIITNGGTMSNAIGIMLARENKSPNTLTNGIKAPSRYKIIVPKGIGHYSVKSAQMWLGCGNNLIEVPTINFKYDLEKLKEALNNNKGNVMGLVAYAGDSRTMTCDDFDEIYNLVKSIDENIWLHADACHGFSLSFSEQLKEKIKGINKFDSITIDPHKVMLTPYVISAILVKDPTKLKSVSSISDLIMKEQFAFGQITPFIGSKSWESLKLWFMMLNYGKEGLQNMVNERHSRAKYLHEKIKENENYITLNEIDINSVMFMVKPSKWDGDIIKLNNFNRKIYDKIREDGLYYLHTFPIEDSGVISQGQTLKPLRYMSGNPNLKEKDIDDMINYIEKISKSL